MPALCTTIADLRTALVPLRATGRSIGFVPTMGALHEGHLTLMRRARERNDFVVVSIFVNPTQFSPGEDFARYPRDLDADARLCASVGVELIFAPEVEEMYPPGDSTWVEVTGPLVEGLCAPHRPGHFRGVTTVCARLFNIVQPDRAYFGEKDYQQLRVIIQMVRDLKFPLEIVPVPTVREASGLAMSSRHAYLTPDERAAAAVLSRALQSAQEAYEAGERDPAALERRAVEVIHSEPRARLQYAEARDAETLTRIATAAHPVVLALAVLIGRTRLIDNVVLGR